MLENYINLVNAMEKLTRFQEEEIIRLKSENIDLKLENNTLKIKAQGLEVELEYYKNEAKSLGEVK